MSNRKERDNKKKLLASIMPGLVRDRGWQEKLELHSIFSRWEKIVDPTTARYAKPLKIVKGTLWLEVENSAWLQQFQYQKLMLLETINATYDDDVRLLDIRFVLPQPERRNERQEARVEFVSPDQQEVARFREQVACIEDEETREALIRLWYLSKACVRKE